jgi:predicted RNA-binding protein with RPS1 domain
MASDHTLMERLCMPAEERTAHRRLSLPFEMMSEDELRTEAEAVPKPQELSDVENNRHKLPLPFAIMSEDEFRTEAVPKPNLSAEARIYRKLPLPFAMEGEFRTEAEPQPEAEPEPEPVDHLNYKGVGQHYSPDQHYSPSKQKPTNPAGQQPGGWGEYLASIGSGQGNLRPEPQGNIRSVGSGQGQNYPAPSSAAQPKHYGQGNLRPEPQGNIRSVGSGQGQNYPALSAPALPKKYQPGAGYYPKRKGGWSSIPKRSIPKPQLMYDPKNDQLYFATNGQDTNSGDYAVQSAEDQLTYQTALAWEAVRAMAERDEVFQAPVVSVNRGGVLCLVHGLKAFLPSRHLTGPLVDENFIGKILPLKFLEVNRKTDHLIVSNRKAVLQMTSFSHGDLVSGVVNKVKARAAFIEVGGMSGLLHVTQVSHDPIDSLKKVFQPGMFVKCMVIDHDKVNGKITLSTKTLEQNPGDMLKNPYAVFERAEATAAAYLGSYAGRKALEFEKSEVNSAYFGVRAGDVAVRNNVLGVGDSLHDSRYGSAANSPNDSRYGSARHTPSSVANLDALLSLQASKPMSKGTVRRTMRSWTPRDYRPEN